MKKDQPLCCGELPGQDFPFLNIGAITPLGAAPAGFAHSESESLGGGERKLSHLGHCWARPAGAAPKGVIAPILRNDY